MSFPLLAGLLPRAKAQVTAPSVDVTTQLHELAERVATLEKQAAEYPAFCAMLQDQWDQYEEKLARIAERYRRERSRLTQERLKEAGEGDTLPDDSIGPQRGNAADPSQLHFPQVAEMTKDQLRRLARTRAQTRAPRAAGE